MDVSELVSKQFNCWFVRLGDGESGAADGDSVFVYYGDVNLERRRLRLGKEGKGKGKHSEEKKTVARWMLTAHATLRRLQS